MILLSIKTIKIMKHKSNNIIANLNVLSIGIIELFLSIVKYKLNKTQKKLLLIQLF